MEKREILEHIKRLAKENGGTPPGWKLFRSETGLGETQWRPKFWLRWGEALIEAGYTPNEFGAKYGEHKVLLKLIELARELGHFPIEGEMTRKKAVDPSFPGLRAIRNFGDKSTRVKRVYDYCCTHNELADVTALCLDAMSTLSAPTDSETQETEKLGFVYLLRHGGRREYKIGRTTNLLRREGEIGIELPEKGEPVHTIKTDDPSGVEKYWHQRFANKRKNGEWFELTAHEVQAFKRWKRIY